MHPFTIDRPRELAAALAFDGPAEFIAGGTDMLQLLKEGVRTPSKLVDLETVLDAGIEQRPGGLRIGAGATMRAVAERPAIAEAFPVVSQALLTSASGQVRNMATIGGNLLQRTRCGYFRDIGFARCNKRVPGSGCAAVDGEHRMHAVLGGSDDCFATHASDLAVALVALDAQLVLIGRDGERRLPVGELHRLPGDTPDLETVLRHGEVIAAVEVATSPLARRSLYLKVRDRASFEWALISAAVALDIDGGEVREARIAMGGVGTKPWRMPRVEAALVGRPATRDSFTAAAELASEGAVPRPQNAFKIPLMRSTLVRALETLGEMP